MSEPLKETVIEFVFPEMGSGDVFWFDKDGRVVVQMYMSWVGPRPENRILTDEEVEQLRAAYVRRASGGEER